MSDEDELQIFLSTSNLLKKSYIVAGEIDPWASSPFAWIRERPSRQVGKIGEQLVSEWCKKKGFNVLQSSDSECDLIINDKRVEIKFSTLWESGVYTFQQIRNQDYAYAIFLGLSPSSAHCWVVRKELLFRYVIGHTPQHTGKIGTETFWLSFQVQSPPDWLMECGGTLSKANIVLNREFS
jgi:hypothetical protein